MAGHRDKLPCDLRWSKALTCLSSELLVPQSSCARQRVSGHREWTPQIASSQGTWSANVDACTDRTRVRDRLGLRLRPTKLRRLGAVAANSSIDRTAAGAPLFRRPCSRTIRQSLQYSRHSGLKHPVTGLARSLCVRPLLLTGCSPRRCCGHLAYELPPQAVLVRLQRSVGSRAGQQPHLPALCDQVKQLFQRHVQER